MILNTLERSKQILFVLIILSMSCKESCKIIPPEMKIQCKIIISLNGISCNGCVSSFISNLNSPYLNQSIFAYIEPNKSQFIPLLEQKNILYKIISNEDMNKLELQNSEFCILKECEIIKRIEIKTDNLPLIFQVLSNLDISKTQ